MEIEALPHEMLIFMMKMRLIGASWEPLGGLLEATWGLLGPLGGLLGALGGPLGAPSSPKLGTSCHLEASWVHLGMRK